MQTSVRFSSRQDKQDLFTDENISTTLGFRCNNFKRRSRCGPSSSTGGLQNTKVACISFNDDKCRLDCTFGSSLGVVSSKQHGTGGGVMGGCLRIAPGLRLRPRQSKQPLTETRQQHGPVTAPGGFHHTRTQSLAEGESFGLVLWKPPL